MGTSQDWQRVYEFWFPAGLDAADLQTHWRMLEWWMRGGANAELPPFLSVVEAAFSLDAYALQIAEEGLQNGQYAALENPWEKFFFLLPLAHMQKARTTWSG